MTAGSEAAIKTGALTKTLDVKTHELGQARKQWSKGKENNEPDEKPRQANKRGSGATVDIGDAGDFFDPRHHSPLNKRYGP